MRCVFSATLTWLLLRGSENQQHNAHRLLFRRLRCDTTNRLTCYFTFSTTDRPVTNKRLSFKIIVKVSCVRNVIYCNVLVEAMLSNWFPVSYFCLFTVLCALINIHSVVEEVLTSFIKVKVAIPRSKNTVTNKIPSKKMIQTIIILKY